MQAAQPASNHPPDPASDQLDLAFFALSDPVRREILHRLDQAPLLVSELAAPFDISLQAVSRHIQVLVRAGLITQARSGRISRCSLQAEPLAAAAAWINHYARYWQTQFDTLAKHLNRIDQDHREKEGTQAMTDYAETRARLDGHRAQIASLQKQMMELQADITPQPVQDYVLANGHGTIRLSELFGEKSDLFVIHNMGTSCAYCTMWADGFNGVYPHLADRAAFVVSSPNPPDVQAKFAAGRGWRFPMVSHAGSSFAEDLGYRRDGGWYPGVSVFQRTANGVVRVSDTELGPHDNLCVVWNLLALLPEDHTNWTPKLRYG